MTIGEPRPKSLGSSVDLGLVTDGPVSLAGVPGVGVVFVGNMLLSRREVSTRQDAMTYLVG